MILITAISDSQASFQRFLAAIILSWEVMIFDNEAFYPRRIRVACAGGSGAIFRWPTASGQANRGAPRHSKAIPRSIDDGSQESRLGLELTRPAGWLPTGSSRQHHHSLGSHCHVWSSHRLREVPAHARWTRPDGPEDRETVLGCCLHQFRSPHQFNRVASNVRHNDSLVQP